MHKSSGCAACGGCPSTLLSSVSLAPLTARERTWVLALKSPEVARMPSYLALRYCSTIRSTTPRRQNMPPATMRNCFLCLSPPILQTIRWYVQWILDSVATLILLAELAIMEEKPDLFCHLLQRPSWSRTEPSLDHLRRTNCERIQDLLQPIRSTFRMVTSHIRLCCMVSPGLG